MHLSLVQSTVIFLWMKGNINQDGRKIAWNCENFVSQISNLHFLKHLYLLNSWCYWQLLIKGGFNGVSMICENNLIPNSQCVWVQTRRLSKQWNVTINHEKNTFCKKCHLGFLLFISNEILKYLILRNEDLRASWLRKKYIYSVAKVYAVLPFYDVKCLCSGGREWEREESHSH